MPDTIDRILTMGSTPDWISPMVALIQDFTNGPRHDFYVDLYAGWSVNDIKKLLKRRGIKVWGDMIADDMIIFSVPQGQAQWAQTILMQSGLPIVSGMIGEVKSKPKSWLDAFADWIFD